MVSFMARVYFFILHSRLPECCSVATQLCMSFKISSKVNLFKFWRAPKTGETETRGGRKYYQSGRRGHRLPKIAAEIRNIFRNHQLFVDRMWLMLYLDNDL